MITDYEKNSRVDATWDKTRSVLWIALLVVISYHMGLGRGRAEKNVGAYSGLKSQYDRIEMQYSSLKARYDALVPQYAAMRERCDTATTQYSALKAQYDRIEAHRAGTTINKPNQ